MQIAAITIMSLKMCSRKLKLSSSLCGERIQNVVFHLGFVTCSILIVKSSKQLEVYSINSSQNVSTPSLPKVLSSRLFLLFWFSPSNFSINNLEPIRKLLNHARWKHNQIEEKPANYRVSYTNEYECHGV